MSGKTIAKKFKENCQLQGQVPLISSGGEKKKGVAVI